MATGGLYGTSTANATVVNPGAESTGLYGNGTQFGGSYFEWFIFQTAASQPATPTGGSWNFTTNTGTPPAGWTSAPPAAPTNQVWVSIALVNSKNATTLTWSAPGLFSYSAGLPILSGTAAPVSGDGQNSQLYIQTSTTPQSIWFKEAGAWVRLTGDVIAIANGGTGATTAAGARTNLGAAASGSNSDITSMAGITGGISTPDFIQFDTAITPTVGIGKLQWDPTHGCMQVGLVGGNVNLQIGQETVVYIYNNTGSTINEGQIVRVIGSQGQRLTVALAQADGDPNSATILGMATENIANNSSGFITTQGVVNNLNTNGFADGTLLYLSPTVPGGFTSTKPVAPQHLVWIGYVVKGNSGGAGSIYIHTQNGYEIDELHNVQITDPVADNSLLVYDSAVEVWKNEAPSAARTSLGLGTSAVLNAGVANGVATLDAGGTVPLSQIPASIQGGVSYQGAWNASTNTPTLTSSVGTKGYYYVVSVAGSTNLNGITSWNIGDWAIFNGTAWEKIDNTDAVTSVNGYTGTVVLTQPDIAGTASLTTAQTLTNKTISGSSNTLSNIGNSSLTNSSIGFTYSGGIAGSASTSLGGTNALSLSAIPNASLANSSLTVNGSTISLGGSATITAANPNALTIGTGLSGTSYNGSSAVTVAIDSTVATLTGTQTLTNKTLTNPTVTNYTETQNTANTGSAITLNLTDGTVENLTLTAGATITMPSVGAGKSFILYLKTGAGGYAVTWATVKWPGGTAPTITSTASRMDIYSFFSDGTNWYGTTVGQNYTP